MLLVAMIAGIVLQAKDGSLCYIDE